MLVAKYKYHLSRKYEFELVIMRKFVGNEVVYSKGFPVGSRRQRCRYSQPLSLVCLAIKISHRLEMVDCSSLVNVAPYWEPLTSFVPFVSFCPKKKKKKQLLYNQVFMPL
ncbi:hypothetical protein M9Y10_039664 [Tritrichomonas musculus]|uniref:Uncharacterized protein n=1 Tax=Tritrichomonas musculus TaxID=1915356 RepID=A0ABR2GNK5_9EUKA